MNFLPSFDFVGAILQVLRRLLYVWTRTQVFPETALELKLQPDLPVCYILQHRHISNLLVLDHECRQFGLPPALGPMVTRQMRSRRSFFFLAQRPGKVTDNPPRNESSLLSSLVASAIDNPHFDVQLVPVTILWGRAPGTQDSILKALLAETWEATSSLRQLLAILIHGRQTVVRFNEPVSLRFLLRNDPNPAHATRRLSRIFRVHFKRQRTLAIGPDLSHRHTQLRALLATPAVRKAVSAEAAEKSISLVKAEGNARRYALEIASDYSNTVVQALIIFLDWVWTRIYDRIEVHNFEQVSRIAAGNSLVYVPCHRSHIDYLLMSYLLFMRGLTPPHIAAGSNLNMPVVGPILRGGGAFFLRRKLKGAALYSAVFLEYLHMMIERGFPIEYYIEGGRSRSGRTLTPRTGMLGMTVQSYLRTRARPLYFVPVYVGYEKLMEGSSYLAELGGKQKKNESLLDLLGAIRLLKRRFGAVHVNFGEPLLLSQFLDGQCADWRDCAFDDPRAPWLRKAVEATATELARRINAAAVINPVNLMALSLLSTPKHTADLRAIHRQIEHLQFFAANTSLPASVVVSQTLPATIIEECLRLELISVRTHALGDMVQASQAQSSLLAYFRNNVIHLFALPALFACLVSHNRILSRSVAKKAIKGIYNLLRAELYLPWEPDQLDQVIEQTEAALMNRKLILCRDESPKILRAPSPGEEVSAELHQLGEIIRPTLERQFLTLALLQHHGSGKITRSLLEESGHLLAQRLSMLYEFNSPEFSEKSLFANVVRNLINAELLHADSEGYLHFDERISVPAAHAQLLLAADVRHSIERMTRIEPPADVPPEGTITDPPTDITAVTPPPSSITQ
ncbi:MAG: glycerol-3-phosphate 1-O-acyltransferase PlsB [Rhodocyclaceae bacterium]|nr:glycerol-3-phosphate 1-O-acyltransferase PlsB [Rhodocyclaceae bacterium]